MQHRVREWSPTNPSPLEIAWDHVLVSLTVQNSIEQTGRKALEEEQFEENSKNANPACNEWVRYRGYLPG
jgi:hypothetical protein